MRTFLGKLSSDTTVCTHMCLHTYTHKGTKVKKVLDITVHTFNLRQADLYEFKVSLVYTACFRTARAVPILKKQNQNQNNQKSRDFFLKRIKKIIYAKGRKGNEVKRCLPAPRPCCINWGFQSHNNSFTGHFQRAGFLSGVENVTRNSIYKLMYHISH